MRSYDILDTPREDDFDDIVHLASQICGTPIAVVNLIDAERQWFKAEVGLGTRETPLETSICSHIILEQEFTMIEDTQVDPRTADNELCTPSDGLRFYAGALLKAENGLPIGTLCVLDNKPNRLNDDQRRALQVLARRVMRELDLRRALKAQAVLRDEMDHRVKNSLANVAAAVNLYRSEAKRTGDAEAAFQAIRRHLDAVASIHEALYASEEDGALDLGAYIENLAAKLEVSLPPNVTVEVDALSLTVSAKVANTIGLIANEFAANTLKHGAPDDSGVAIRYRLVRKNGSLVFTCSNNSSEGPPRQNGKAGLGQRLIEVSVTRHGGEVSQVASREGFSLVATVPLGAS